MSRHPQGWSKWTHREKGGEYSVLTVALGAGPDHGVEFVYYMGVDRANGSLTAYVRRLDDWHRAMVPLGAERDDDDLDELI